MLDPPTNPLSSSSTLQLCKLKHPTNWSRFERAEITESQLFEEFWRPEVDGPEFDGSALREHMVSGW